MMGKNMNGIERAKLLMVLKKNNTEDILEMMETMDQWEQIQDNPYMAAGEQLKNAPAVVGPTVVTIDGSGPNVSSTGTPRWIDDGTG